MAEDLPDDFLGSFNLHETVTIQSDKPPSPAQIKREALKNMLDKRLIYLNQQLTEMNGIKEAKLQSIKEKEERIKNWEKSSSIEMNEINKLAAQIKQLLLDRSNEKSKVMYQNDISRYQQLEMDELNKAKERILIRGQTIPINFSTHTSRYYNEQIKKSQLKLNEWNDKCLNLKQEEDKLRNQEQDLVNKYNAQLPDITQTKTSLKTDKQYWDSTDYKQLERRMELTKDEIRRAELMPSYIDYANKYGIMYDENDEDKLFIDCNEYHQDRLLNRANGGRGFFVNEGCPHRWSGRCRGWYTNDHRCTCGNYKGWSWNTDGWDAGDVYKFNIDSKQPYGNAETQW